MKFEVLLSDPALCAWGSSLLALWASARYAPFPWPGKKMEPFLAVLLRVAGGALLLWAGSDKIGNPADFSKAVENYHILPASLVPIAAVVIPWLEFFTGSCLLVGFRIPGAAWVLCILMGLYSLSLGINLLRGVEMNCACLPTSTGKITWWSILRDFFLFLMGVALLNTSRFLGSLDAYFVRKKTP